jgi:preprotein translocase subunit YajC
MDNSVSVIDLTTTAIFRLALLAQEPAPDAGEVNLLTSFFGNPVNLLMLAVMLFFFIVIWPQQRQAKSQQLAHEKALAGMKKNDRIITSGGIHGVIIQANADEPVITIRIDENSGARMTVNRDAVVKVFTET